MSDDYEARYLRLNCTPPLQRLYDYKHMYDYTVPRDELCKMLRNAKELERGLDDCLP